MSDLTAAERARLGEALLLEGPDAVIYADRAGRVRFWNAGAERIFGFTAAEALGQSLDLIIPAGLRQRHWQGYEAMKASGRSRYGAGDLLAVPALNRAGETLSIQFTVTPVASRPAGSLALLREVTRSFTELKRLRALAAGRG